MLHPFSNRARLWEANGIALRRKVALTADELLDPWRLASEVGLTVIDAQQVLYRLDAADRQLLLHQRRSNWSGGVYARALPDGTYLCILNPTHSRRRNKMTLMEEISHLHLGHAPTKLRPLADGIRARDYHRQQEEEAYGVGASAPIPWRVLYPLIDRVISVEELAERFDVTVQLIEYRIKVTGAYRFYQSRQSSNFRSLAVG